MSLIQESILYSFCGLDLKYCMSVFTYGGFYEYGNWKAGVLVGKGKVRCVKIWKMGNVFWYDAAKLRIGE
jgi:hypothetical protein